MPTATDNVENPLATPAAQRLGFHRADQLGAPTRGFHSGLVHPRPLDTWRELHLDGHDPGPARPSRWSPRTTDATWVVRRFGLGPTGELGHLGRCPQHGDFPQCREAVHLPLQIALGLVERRQRAGADIHGIQLSRGAGEGLTRAVSLSDRAQTPRRRRCGGQAPRPSASGSGGSGLGPARPGDADQNGWSPTACSPVPVRCSAKAGRSSCPLPDSPRTSTPCSPVAARRRASTIVPAMA